MLRQQHKYKHVQEHLRARAQQVTCSRVRLYCTHVAAGSSAYLDNDTHSDADTCLQADLPDQFVSKAQDSQLHLLPLRHVEAHKQATAAWQLRRGSPRAPGSTCFCAAVPHLYALLPAPQCPTSTHLSLCCSAPPPRNAPCASVPHLYAMLFAMQCPTSAQCFLCWSASLLCTAPCAPVPNLYAMLTAL